MGQIVAVVGIQAGDAQGSAPQISHSYLQLSKATGSQKYLWVLFSPFISQMENKALVQVTWSDSSKTTLDSQVP